MNNYPGNSPGKSRVRTLGYDFALKKIGAERYSAGRHIVIASEDCGDIRFLVEHNIPHGNIIACDINYRAVQAAIPWGVKAWALSIQDAVKEALIPNNDVIHDIATINVDLCNSLDKGWPILREVLRAAWKAPKKPIVFFTFAKRGRIRGDVMRELYLETSIKESKLWWYKGVKAFHSYMSTTHMSNGSPMTMAIL